MMKVLACSTRMVEKVLGPPQRGLVHSAFSAAANLIFTDGMLLSLNASPHPTSNTFLTRVCTPFLLPNGVLLSSQAGAWPFAELRAGMPVVLGTGWLAIEAISCSLDCASCARWNPQIERPLQLDHGQIRANARWLVQFCQHYRPQGSDGILAHESDEPILALAARVCGRGPGLTPGGDDFLAGWMAAGWLLYGPQPAFLASCQGINEIARQYTHVLSQCWLAYAAAGDVALPIGELLTALNDPNHERLEHAASTVLALGATTGYHLLQGILYGIEHYPLF